MADTPNTSQRPDPPWLAGVVKAEPSAPLIIPYMAYLVLLAFNDAFPTKLLPVAIVLHIILGFWAALMFRRHWPAMGDWRWPIALVGGLAAAFLWVAGQHALDGLTIGNYDLGGRLLLYPGVPEPHDPREDFGTGSLFWLYAVLKITRACTIVPLVEELFWRGFILRAFIRWRRPEEVPWGTFAWKAMIGSALLSTIQHPDNWGVSIGCWLLFNAMFYWTKSLKCLILTHAITNLALYSYVIRAGDWRFW